MFFIAFNLALVITLLAWQSCNWWLVNTFCFCCFFYLWILSVAQCKKCGRSRKR